MKSIDPQIKKSAAFLILLLIALFVYISYLQVFEGPLLSNNPYNRRTAEHTKQIERGQILDRNNKVLAYSKQVGSQFERHYPYGAITGAVIGYTHEKYGRSGIENAADRFLTGMNRPLEQLGPLSHLLQPSQGNQVKLTLDAHLQELGYRLLGNRRGAIVMISPKTGAILALVSKPSFDPSLIENNWAAWNQSPDAILLNRATQGLYPPGSTIKVLTADVALTEKVATTTQTYQSPGFLKISSDYTLHEINDKNYGSLTLEQALTVSSNVVFGQLALDIGPTKLKKGYERFGFTQSLNNELQEANSRLPDFNNLSKGDLAQAGIGQASLLVTPLHMAMLSAAIANHGIIMKPYLINQVLSPAGATLEQTTTKEWLTVTTPEIAKILTDMMISVVQNGTASAAALSNIKVAGKTGTAENPHGQPHAWFIGFAPANDPQVAIAIIVENGGGGGSIAAPIAKQLFAEAIH